MVWKGYENAAITDDQMRRMVGGRKHYNALQQMRVMERRAAVAQLLRQGGLRQAEIARRLQVSESTITRDVAFLIDRARQGRCPICGRGSED